MALCDLAIRALLIVALFAPTAARADDEAANRAHVATDPWGQCYARSIPTENYGVAGETIVYRVRPEKDEEIARYPWFAPQLHLSCNVSDGEGVVAPALAQIGPWPRGQAPDKATLALALHFNGEEKARFSTLDIAAGDPANASCSVSHYTVIALVDGFAADGASFAVTTVDGRRLTFDSATGDMIESVAAAGAREPFGECYRAEYQGTQ